ncbi:Na+-translocating ferredoxin:NAD+ oxidoreductase subunit C [Candidatus Magnetomoraceae bacterium gMMP-15]
MIKSPFINLAKPTFRYDSPPDTIEEIPIPDRVTLLLGQAFDKGGAYAIKTGDEVKTGQKLQLLEGSDVYAVSTVTGKIINIAPFTGDFGQVYTAVTIEKQGSDEWDTGFGEIEKPDLNAAINFLQYLPGSPCFKSFAEAEGGIETVIINAMDQDLLVTANQYVVQKSMKDIKVAVDFLANIEGVKRVVIVVPEKLASLAVATGAEIEQVNTVYPSALTPFIMKEALDKTLPAGKSPENVGVAFITGESAAALGAALINNKQPVNKVLTVIKKDGSTTNVTARIGTPVKDILATVGITTADGDRVILGGPMRGSAIYSEDIPIQPATDAIMVQDGGNLSRVSDYPCINCGECVRICPANVPVNVLVRFLENAQYIEAADQCDLYSCVECGLCSYVCPSGMPLFQYIRLGKYELALIESGEAD